MANTLAYYGTATITAVKCFIVQDPGAVGSSTFRASTAKYKTGLSTMAVGLTATPNRSKSTRRQSQGPRARPSPSTGTSQGPML